MTTTSLVPTPGAGTSSRLEAGLGFRLGRVHRAIRGAWQARIADLALSSAQASALRAVVERPGSGLRELARTLGTDPMNAKRLADGLETSGLICSCAASADRRLRVLEPTDAGRALALVLEQRAQAWAATLESMVSEGDIAAMLRTFDRLEAGIAALTAAADDSAEEAPRG